MTVLHLANTQAENAKLKKGNATLGAHTKKRPEKALLAGRKIPKQSRHFAIGVGLPPCHCKRKKILSAAKEMQAKNIIDAPGKREKVWGQSDPTRWRWRRTAPKQARWGVPSL